ncbi:hypothetical protein ACG7TL_002466 [Trametes sanguinea]
MVHPPCTTPLLRRKTQMMSDSVPETSTGLIQDELEEAMRDPSIPPEDIASLVITLARKAVEEPPQDEIRGRDDDTPGLEGFLWDLWYKLLEIADVDPSMHDRLASILTAIAAKGKEGCEGWRLWNRDIDWADRPLFGAALRESMNVNGRAMEMPYPPEVEAALAGEPPTDSPHSQSAAAARTIWLNENAFVARLWALGVADMEFYGISTMRMELEPYSLPPERRPPCESHYTQAVDIENAAQWVRIAGKKMYECREILGPKGNPDWDPHRGAPGSSGGTWDGVDGFHPDRWALWKDIFKKVSEGGGWKKMIDAAKAAVEAMEQVELTNVDKMVGREKLSTLSEATEPYMREANAAMRDPSISPEEVASLFLAHSRKAVAEAAKDGSTSTSRDDDTPGLELFLWDLWYLLIDIASEDPSLHDRLASILKAVMAKGKEGFEGWRLWNEDIDWANLPLFGPTVREYHNGTARPDVVDGTGHIIMPPYPPEVLAALAGDPPTDSPLSRAAARARTKWLNQNAFTARLWTLDIMDWATYGISTMRMELEPYSLPPERRSLDEASLPQELRIENAAVWIRVAGKKMYESHEILGPKGNPEWDSKRGAPGSSGGTWDGVDGYHPDRWAHWKNIFKKISEGEGRQDMLDAAKWKPWSRSSANIQTISTEKSKKWRQYPRVLDRERIPPLDSLAIQYKSSRVVKTSSTKSRPQTVHESCSEKQCSDKSRKGRDQDAGVPGDNVLEGAALDPEEEPLLDEPVDIAFALKAAKLLGPDSMAFAEKTMPAAQWLAGLVCLQKTQMGAVCEQPDQYTGGQ